MGTSQRRFILRMDDVGASTKQYNQYALIRSRPFGISFPTPFFLQWGALKRFSLWRGWAPYNELTVTQWHSIFEVLESARACLTIGVTATWAEREDMLLPFYEKFPAQAAVLREGVEAGLLEIANHGLTHCVLTNSVFRPHRFSSNRTFHREFWSWVPPTQHYDHIARSQEILSQTFRCEVVTFIPPGGVWTEDTERAAVGCGIRFLCAHEAVAPTGHSRNGIRYVGTAPMADFHDREVSLFGIAWLERLLRSHMDKTFTFVRDFFG